MAYPVLAAGIGLGFLLDRDLGRSLLLIGLGIAPIGLISVAADIRWGHYFLVAGVLTVAVLTPYLLDRFVFRRHVIRFPIRSGRHWTLSEKIYMVTVPALAWLIMPFYFINSGTYLNWPAPREPSELARLFVGVNAVGLWDELFFICSVFTLLRRHFPTLAGQPAAGGDLRVLPLGAGLHQLGAVPHLPVRPGAGLSVRPHPLAAVRADHAPGLRLCAVVDPGVRPQPGLDTPDLLY